jgi:hypothetical protein
MSVVNIASSRNLPESGHDHLAELAVSFSRRLTRVPLDGILAAIAESLAELATALPAEGCRLVEFSDTGAAARVHLRTGAAKPGDRALAETAAEAWLSERRARGEIVSIARPEDLPRDGVVAGELARITGPY